MLNILDIKKNKKILSSEQEVKLSDIISYGCQKSMKRKVRKIIEFSFYSLEDSDYWRRFKIVGNDIEYRAKNSLAQTAELKEIRKDLLRQANNGED